MYRSQVVENCYHISRATFLLLIVYSYLESFQTL